MSKPGGDEDLLVVELRSVLLGQKPATEEWKRVGGLANTLSDGFSGSCNKPALAAATRLLVLGDNVQEWRDFFAASKSRCMGIEAGSRIYLLWVILSVAAVASHPELEKPALGWLSYVLDLLRRMQAPDGRLLLVGQRSAGHPPDPGLWEWFVAMVFLGDVGRAESWCKQFGVGLKKRWEYDATKALLGTLQDAAKMGPEPHEMLVAYHFAAGDGWQAVWTDKTLNPNTGSILGVLWTPDRIDWLPANGGAHIREQFDGATCALASDGRTLVYASSLYGHAELRLPAPAGAPIVPPATVPSPAPVTPAKPRQPHPWWMFWAAMALLVVPSFGQDAGRCGYTDTKSNECSGLVLHTNLVVTAFHCLEVGSKTRFNLHFATIAKVTPELDLVFLTIETGDFGNVRFGDASVGDPVYYMGNPGSHRCVRVEGRVADKDDTHLFIDGMIRAGASGSGVYNAAGELVGIMQGLESIDKDPGFGIALQSKYVRKEMP